MIKGIYCLVLSCAPFRERVGALGEIEFREGYYVYVGSALGPGGLSRVARHARISKNPGRRPHWHIDYLLRSPSCTLLTAYCFPTTGRAECRLASLLTGIPVPGFGCSDCRCVSHLYYYSSHPETDIGEASAELSLSAHSKTIKNP